MSTAAVIDAYDTTVATTDATTLTAERERARSYNAELAAGGDTYAEARRMQALGELAHAVADESAPATAADARAEAAYERYRQLLSVGDSPIMGSVVIPPLGVEAPIYHGTAAEELQKGAGHLIGSSLPVGGPSTHCVIAAHSGLPNAELFSHLSDLRRGDEFQLAVLGEFLVYKVDRITVVQPDEVDALEIQPGRDLCTLVTCTPYGINTHRLLVRGHRVFPQEGAMPTPASENGIGFWVAVLVLAAAGTATVVAIRLRKRRRRLGRGRQW